MPERDLIPARIIGGRVAHKSKSKPYAFGCNPAAIRRAQREGYDGIDLDHRTNKEGHGWLFHQSNPTRRDGWADPQGKVHDSTPITAMSDADCDRLRYQGQPSMSLRDGFVFCKAAGLIPCIEAKTLAGVDYWRGVRELGHEIGVQPVIMSLGGPLSIPGSRRLKTAHDAGLVTMFLWRRGSRIPPFVDLVKSHNRRPIYRLDGVLIPPVPTPAAHVRPPVRFPWRRFKPRWRRRHPALWRRIVAWRRHHPRRGNR